MVCSTAAVQYVMKMVMEVGDNSATGSPPRPRRTKHRLIHIVSVQTVSKKMSALTPSL
jgi:hypothetical protein